MYCVKGGVIVKRVKEANILDTLVFEKKPYMGYTKKSKLKINQEYIEQCNAILKQVKTKHQIIDMFDPSNGSIIVHNTKQHSDMTDVYKDSG